MLECDADDLIAASLAPGMQQRALEALAAARPAPVPKAHDDAKEGEEVEEEVEEEQEVDLT